MTLFIKFIFYKLGVAGGDSQGKGDGFMGGGKNGSSGTISAPLYR